MRRIARPFGADAVQSAVKAILQTWALSVLGLAAADDRVQSVSNSLPPAWKRPRNAARSDQLNTSGGGNNNVIIFNLRQSWR